MIMTNFVKTKYHLQSLCCGETLEDVNWELNCPNNEKPSLLRAIYNNKQLFVDETLPVEMTPETPQNNGQSSVVQIVDLITPLPATRVIRRPVEVDLTCDLEDEVFVVLVSKHVYWQHSIKLIILFYCRKTL